MKIVLPSAGHDVFSYGQVGFWNGEAGRLATVLSQRNPFQNISMFLPDSVGVLKQEKYVQKTTARGQKSTSDKDA